MGARPYDPSLGRFLAVDPIDGGSLNNYDYAGQDPVNGYDLSGTIEDAELGGDAVSGGNSGTSGNYTDPGDSSGNRVPDPTSNPILQDRTDELKMDSDRPRRSRGSRTWWTRPSAADAEQDLSLLTDGQVKSERPNPNGSRTYFIKGGGTVTIYRSNTSGGGTKIFVNNFGRITKFYYR